MDAVISQLIPPVVIISSCGLLCMAQFARYTALVGRVRGFHKERLDLLRGLLTGELMDEITRKRCESLEYQAHRAISYLKMIRIALLLLVAAIICMILCSLSIGASMVFPIDRTLSVLFFVTGLICLLGGMLFVFRELLASLNLVKMEHSEVEALDKYLMSKMGQEEFEDKESDQ